MTEQTNSKDGVAVIATTRWKYQARELESRWVLLRSMSLVSSVDGTPSLPVSLG